MIYSEHKTRRRAVNENLQQLPDLDSFVTFAPASCVKL